MRRREKRLTVALVVFAAMACLPAIATVPNTEPDVDFAANRCTDILNLPPSEQRAILRSFYCMIVDIDSPVPDVAPTEEPASQTSLERRSSIRAVLATVTAKLLTWLLR